VVSYAKKTLRIGIVAGEASGDLLAAKLLQTLRARGLHIISEGVTGPSMIAQNCRSLASIDVLAVMGISSILKRLPKIICLRRSLIRHFIQNKPDIFIGIDAPEFNLALEKKLKQHGITVIHYVAPSVWAWRQNRVKTLSKFDRVLAILPFELALLKKFKVPVTFVGHPLADELPSITNTDARTQLNLSQTATIIALLPGSRENEIHYLGRLFIQVAKCCRDINPNLIFVAAMTNQKRAEQFIEIWKKTEPQLILKIVTQQTHQVLAAADVVLVTSGTATLETMLFRKPMVVVYKLSKLMFAILKRIIRVRFIALPNLLANRLLVPEFIQKDATVDHIVNALFNFLQNPDKVRALKKSFDQITQQLRCGANERAADALLDVLQMHQE
jgi:lipid-A-disaccharide synthase